jgi:ABC-2 type transport system permease protein
VGPYLTAAWTGAKRALVARNELAVRLLFYPIVLIVLLALWRAAVAANGGAVAGYSFVAVAWYLTASEGAVIPTDPRLIEHLGDDIGSGAVAIDMLRPVRVVAFRASSEMGESVARLMCVGLIGLGFTSLVVGPPPEAPAALLAVPSLFLAVACNVCAQFAFAAIAFWFNDAKATWFLYQKLVFLVGGMLLPLEFLPGWLQTASRVLPFWTMSYAPARLASGHYEPWLVGGQAAWLVALGACCVAAFSWGESRLQVGGG